MPRSKSDYQSIASMREDDYFKQSLGIGRIPSVERLRQRLDESGTRLVSTINRCSRTMLKRLEAPISGYRSGLIPLDVDVFPQDNSKTKKEGVSRTCKNYDGYAPMAAYLGKEGWCLEVELRPGSQHSQNGFVEFIKRVISNARELTSQPLLVRADSGNDGRPGGRRQCTLHRQVEPKAERLHSPARQGVCPGGSEDAQKRETCLHHCRGGA
nr:transposase [Desulfobulbus rhabdoformis]